jgi:hypothetical protein
VFTVYFFGATAEVRTAATLVLVRSDCRSTDSSDTGVGEGRMEARILQIRKLLITSENPFCLAPGTQITTVYYTGEQCCQYKHLQLQFGCRGAWIT